MTPQTQQHNEPRPRDTLGSVSVAVTPELITVDVEVVAGNGQLLKAAARSDGTGSVEKIEKPKPSPTAAPLDRLAAASTEPQRDQWQEAGSFLEAIASPGKVLKFARAVWSKLTEGPATDAAINFRASCCFGLTLDGERVTNQCPSLHEHNGKYFCRSCGCPNWKLADLMPQNKKPIGRGAHGEPVWDWTTSKLAYPQLTCPKRKFGPVRGRRNHDQG